VSAAGQDEIRPITFLFADIVGSTSLGERLPAEEVKALVGECVSRMSRAVEQHGGKVQAYMGDGICAYFGLPIAHEDDPELAARAALRILELVLEYSQDVREAWKIDDFNVRVGINSGRVAVGMVGAEGLTEIALGDAANVAARLQSAADPGTIWVGEATARRLFDRFELEAQGEQRVKGREHAVSAWRLLRPLATNEATQGAPIVGRGHELGQLTAALEQLTGSGRSGAVLLTGETGIGKSRLVDELRRVAGEQTTWLEGHCLSYGGPIAAPFVEMLRRWLRVEEDSGEVVIRTRAQARLGAVLGESAPAAIPFLGRLLGVRLIVGAETAPPQPVDPADEIRSAFTGWLEALVRDRPLVIVVEDAHWLDVAGRELAEQILDLLDRIPILLVTTLRLGSSGAGGALRLRALGEYAYRVTEIALGPLDADSSARLADLLAAEPLDSITRSLIVNRAEGNPLYLEELVRGMREGAEIADRHAWTVSLPIASLVPPALDSVLVSRIDTLDAGPRGTAQLAAVIGRQFSRRLLAHVQGDESLDASLSALLRAEVIREAGGSLDREYVFRHGLLQEAALSTMTTAHRQQLYGRVAEAIEELFPGDQESRLEMLAHYSAQSGNFGKARHYLEHAAERAVELGAPDHAVELLQRAKRAAERDLDEEGARRIERRLAELGA
jgi:class 3 adenylate cyclase